MHSALCWVDPAMGVLWLLLLATGVGGDTGYWWINSEGVFGGSNTQGVGYTGAGYDQQSGGPERKTEAGTGDTGSPGGGNRRNEDVNPNKKSKRINSDSGNKKGKS